MSILERLKSSLQRDGAGSTLAKFRAAIVDHCFDSYYGLDTCAMAGLEDLTITSSSREHGVKYQAARVLVLRKLFQILMPLFPSNSVIVDFGCGKGRVLLVGMEFPFKEVKGVEFAKELCAAANNNIARYKAKKTLQTPCAAIEADAATYRIATDENVFFYYNPFDEVLMAKTVENIITSARFHPRKIHIVYLNPKHHGVMDSRSELSLIQDSHIWGNRFRVYTNQPGVRE